MSESIVRDESYSVGHAHLDTHHKNLVSIINMLADDLDEKMKEAGCVTLSTI